MFTKLLFFVFVQSSTAVIRRINDSYNVRMPPLFHLDNYEECFDEPDAIYCLAEMSLVSDEPSELLSVMQDISKSFTHYNYTLLRYGYCMKKTCNKFFEVPGSYLDLRSSLEACTNETIYSEYKLKTRLTDMVDCSKRDRNLPIDFVDISVGAVCIVILMVNLTGSLCDHYLEKKRDRGGLRFLYCFSIFRNWKKFIRTPGEEQDPRLKGLRGIHGIRALSIIFVIVGHSCMIGAVFAVNPTLAEGLYQLKVNTIAINGALIMQTFLIISSFLLVYNWLIHSEKHELSWNMLPKQVIRRWLRLTPAYAVVFALTATWFSRLASGPHWKKIMYNELVDCRHNWWKHLFYINNYFQTTNCMEQTWYLAADTQLYYMGVIVFLMCRTALSRKVVLSLLFVVGMIVPALHTYYQNLNGVMVPSPDAALRLFMDDPTFNKVFIKGHTNLTGYVIGMAIGYIIFYWQKAGGNPKQFQKYRYLYWSMFLLVILCLFSGSIFMIDGPPLPTYVHLLYAALQKPIFGIIMGILIAGIIIQFEGLYRTILEWQPFTFISRLSFSAYLLHEVFIRSEVASIIAVQRISIIGIGLKSCTIVTGTFIVAFLFWMLVETPFANLIGVYFRKPAAQTDERNKEAVQESKKTEDDNRIDMSHTKTENDNRIDMSHTKTEDGTIVIKMGTRI